MRIICLLSVLVGTPAYAVGITLELPLYVNHFVPVVDGLVEYNEGLGNNAGIALEFSLTDEPSDNIAHIGAGTYENSVNNTSYYVYAGWMLGKRHILALPVEYGVEMALATGYSEYTTDEGETQNTPLGEFAVLAGPYVKIGGKHALKLRVPTVFVSVSYQYSFD